MYNPLQVNLPIFDGPLDLLLHLVRKQELDIKELRLADLTEPYLAYVEQMQELNLDQAGEFLAIAATLLWIKSRSLLPNEALPDDEPDPETLEQMLVLRLQEYQRFKDAAVQLADRDLLGRDVFAHHPPREAGAPAAEAPVFEEVSLFRLLEAFREALERVDTVRDLHIVPERQRVEDKVDSLLRSIAQGDGMFLHDLFAEAEDRQELILTFIAILELVRLQALRVSQAAPDGPVLCAPTERMRSGGAEFRALVLAGVMGKPASEAAVRSGSAATAEPDAPERNATEQDAQP